MNNDNITQAAANKAAEEGGLHDAAIAAAEEWANAEFFHAKNLGAGGPGAAERCNKAEIACRTAINELAADRASRQDELTFTVDGVVMSALEYIDFLHDQRASRQVANKAEVEPTAWLIEPTSVAHKGMKREVQFDRPMVLKSDFAVTPLYATPPATTGASTVLTDERIENLWHEACLNHVDLDDSAIPEFARAIAREVAAQAGQVAVPGWISVKDRLPEFDFEAHKVSMFRKVIGVLIDGSVHAMQYRASGWTAEEAKFSWEFADGRSCKSHLVTHWAPLPAAP